MKRLLIISALLITNYYLLITPLLAQDQPVFDFERAYNDYTYNYNLYREAHTAYIKARQAYLNYKTLTSKNEAKDKTLIMLQARDLVVKTYLTAIRMKLAETTGISNYEQNILYLKLDDEINWYQEHYDSLPSAATLEDLISLSQRTEDRYQKTEILVYQSLVTVLAGKETTLREELSQIVESLKEKIIEIKAKGDKDPTLLERWLLEAENRLTRSQEKENESHDLLDKLKPYDQNKNRTYNKAQQIIKESHQYLKEANSYLQELIKEVKRAD